MSSSPKAWGRYVDTPAATGLHLELLLFHNFILICDVYSFSQTGNRQWMAGRNDYKQLMIVLQHCSTLLLVFKYGKQAQWKLFSLVNKYSLEDVFLTAYLWTHLLKKLWIVIGLVYINNQNIDSVLMNFLLFSNIYLHYYFWAYI